MSTAVRVDTHQWEDLVRRLRDTAPVLDDIAGHLETSTDQRFEEGRAPGGSPWPASLRARLTGGRTLVDTARLRQSITSTTGPDWAEVGSNVRYAAIHQHGGEIRPRSAPALAFRLTGGRWVRAKKVTIPARPFLGIDGEDETAIVQIVTDWVTRQAGNRGRARP